MPHFKKVVGQKCYLSPITEESAEIYTKWMNDPEITVNLTTLPKNITIEGEKEFIRKASAENEYIFGIVDLATDRIIGNCGLMRIDFIQRVAELGILIGDKEFWNKGYGTEAMNLLLDYAFNALNLHNVMLFVKEYNLRAYHVYEKIGFKEIGRRRQAEQFAGKRYDLILMDILSDEFKFSVLKDAIKE